MNVIYMKYAKQLVKNGLNNESRYAKSKEWWMDVKNTNIHQIECLKSSRYNVNDGYRCKECKTTS